MKNLLMIFGVVLFSVTILTSCTSADKKVDTVDSEVAPMDDITEIPEESPNPEADTKKQWLNCRVCHGKGILECQNCHGTGTEECDNCNGSGLGPDKDKNCTTCYGKGTHSCWKCAGHGNYGNCSYCKGRGQVQE